MEVITDYFERAREAGGVRELLAHLAAVPLFAGLNESQLIYLAAQMQGRSYAPAERIFEQGSQGQDLHVVLEGSAELRQRTPDGRERTVARLPAGQSYGEIGFITGEPRNLAAVNGPVRGLQLVLNAFDFERVLALSPDIGQAMYRRLVEMISGRMRQLPAATRNYLMWGYGAAPAPEPPRRSPAAMLPLALGVLLLAVAIFGARGHGWIP